MVCSTPAVSLLKLGEGESRTQKQHAGTPVTLKAQVDAHNEGPLSLDVARLPAGGGNSLKVWSYERQGHRGATPKDSLPQ